MDPHRLISPRPHNRGVCASALLSCLLLAGCAGTQELDETSPYYRVPTDSTLTIRNKVEFSPGRTRVFFQNGRVAFGFDSYAANCNLEIRKIDREARQVVEPGAYRVSRVQNSLEEVVQAGPVQLASAGLMLAGMDAGDMGTSMVYRGYHLWLDGPDPNVMRLSCRGAYADPVRAYPPSIEEIRSALGDLFALELTATKAP